jgi:hypothetical protein
VRLLNGLGITYAKHPPSIATLATDLETNEPPVHQEEDDA